MNPDVIPLEFAIPLAIVLWTWLAIVCAADRRARRRAVSENYRRQEHAR